MEILVVVISLFVFGVFFVVVIVLFRIFVLGDVLDFFVELVSGFCFVYFVWFFLLLSVYRKELIFEYKNRIKWLVWVEYILVIIVFFVICVIGFVVIYYNVNRFLL